jgi:hydrogenase expression/formation protein HypC
MCLGVPGRVTEIYREDDLLMGKVDFGGISKRVCLEHTPEVQTGNYVIVHVGFALSQVDAEEAQRIFQFLDEMNELGEVRDSVP